jgi:hypothetical protein
MNLSGGSTKDLQYNIYDIGVDHNLFLHTEVKGLPRENGLWKENFA